MSHQQVDAIVLLVPRVLPSMEVSNSPGDRMKNLISAHRFPEPQISLLGSQCRRTLWQMVQKMNDQGSPHTAAFLVKAA